MYKIVRSFLFLFPPEGVHYFSMNCLKLLCSIGFLRKYLTSFFSPRAMGNRQWAMGNLNFKNPVGLGAGFDKNAKYLRELETLGFGFVEIGTVTPLPQHGNEKPRMFRLAKDKALINRMGFNNEGVKRIAERLRQWRDRQWSIVNGQFRDTHSLLTIDHSQLTSHNSRLIIGGNIGKNKITPNEEAWKDYEICFKELYPYVDYFVVNVSSPNTPGLRELQEKESLRKILSHLQTLDQQFVKTAEINPKPILLKISPDLTKEQLDEVIDLVMEIKLDGLVVSNTTISREQLVTHNSKLITIGAGGLSGLPLKKRNTEIVKYISTKTNGLIPIIASGGIFDGTDAKEKLDVGATLVQVWTGFIFQGPSIVKQICKSIYQKNN